MKSRIITCFAALGLLLAQPAVHAAPSTARQHISMDADWRFQKGDIDSLDGTPIPKWNWIEATDSETPGIGYSSPNQSIGGAWREAASGEDTFHGRQGYAWYRAELPNVMGANRILHFESIDDNATVFVNGVKLLHHEGWNEEFDVPLEANWNANSKNVVAVLVQNTNGGGGIGVASVRTSSPVADKGPASPDYKDSGWRTLHLPHDFVVEGTFDPRTDAGHGSLPTGVGWYRKTFDVAAKDKGLQLSLAFDGVYRNSKVWLNGHLLGQHKSGYTGFRYDITSVVNYGGKNIVAVHADARAQEGWWYEGGGIYRHVWLDKTAPIHIPFGGIAIQPRVAPSGEARIRVFTELANPLQQPVDVDVSYVILDSKGRRVYRSTPVQNASQNHSLLRSSRLVVFQPHLWSIEDPYLYRLIVELEQNGTVIDSVTTPFGIRTVRFDANKGLFLNEEPVKIQGTCNHQDFAGVGIAMPDNLLEWRIKKLKEMGSNAYRCSHNPPTAELLDACDRLGMVVMDESRHLGDTSSSKASSGTKYDDLSELKEMLLRDRNHPSIIMWSMCNEENLQGTDEGARIFSAMKKVTKALDPIRPVTCAMNGGWGEGISLVQDLQGCNYNPGGYDALHKRLPNLPMYGSETASAVSSRGEYVTDPEKGYVSAYDVNAPSWAQTAEVAWRALAEREYMAGGYVWTGFDYRGEPTPYGWPCINSHFGIMDMCGFPKDSYYYYTSWWGAKPVVHLLPHWNWRGKEGQPIDVWCHSNADKVELFLNGKSLGMKDVPRLSHLEWKVPYVPGTLMAKGYKNGKVVATDRVVTTGAATRIRLTADSHSMRADGESVTPVTVTLLDAKGNVVPFADNEVAFSVEGAGEIAGVGNGDASSHEPDHASKRRAYHGLCMAVVRAGLRSGTITLIASALGLPLGTLTIEVR